jgi:DHA2 family multidrug resistance protein
MPSAAPPITPYRGIVTVCVMMATTMQALDTTIANIALPHMQGSFSASQDQVNWVLTSYIVAAAIATPPTGWIARRFGRTRILLVAVAGFTIASMLCGLAQSIEQMVLFRLMQGLCGASLVPLSQSIMLDIYPREQQASAMAMWGVGVMVGPIIGPTLGGWLTENLDWRWVFFINLPIGVVTWLGLKTFLRETSKAETIPFDWFGFGTLSVALGGLQLMLDRGEQLDWFDSPEIIIETAAAGLAFYLFLVHTFSAKHPFIPPSLFKDRNFLLGSASIFTLGVVVFATMALLTPFLQQVLGFPVVTAGLTLGSRGIGTMFAMFLTGRLAGRVDNRYVLVLGVLLMFLSLHSMIGFTYDVSQETVALSGLEQGIGIGFLFVTLSTTSFSSLSPSQRTEGASVFTLSRNIGSAIGISIFGSLLSQGTRVNHAEISGYVTPFNRMLATDAPGLFGPDRVHAAAQLDQLIDKEAVTIAYIDDFKLMMILGLAVLPLVLMVRPNQGAAKSDPVVLD